MKKNSLKIQDFKSKLSHAQIIKSKSLKQAKGGMSDPPPFGKDWQSQIIEC